MNTFSRLWGVKTPAEAQAMIDEQKAEAVAALNGREPANLEGVRHRTAHLRMHKILQKCGDFS